MALSMEEQRMLDEMERQLAIDDPRLATRLRIWSARLPGAFTSPRAKTISGVLALVLIAAVTIMMFVLSPYGLTAPAPPSDHAIVRSEGAQRGEPGAGRRLAGPGGRPAGQDSRHS